MDWVIAYLLRRMLTCSLWFYCAHVLYSMVLGKKPPDKSPLTAPPGSKPPGEKPSGKKPFSKSPPENNPPEIYHPLKWSLKSPPPKKPPGKKPSVGKAPCKKPPEKNWNKPPYKSKSMYIVQCRSSVKNSFIHYHRSLVHVRIQLIRADRNAMEIVIFSSKIFLLTKISTIFYFLFIF